MKALVSIIVPCYNHEKYIKDCLLSIINQTYKNIEVIICDDCSPDNSFNIINSMEFALKDRFENVVIINNKINQGVTKNLNKMLKIANGKYIKEIASDDILDPNCIKNLVEYIENNENYDVVFSNAVYVTEEFKYDRNTVNFDNKYYTSPPLFGRNLTGEICCNNFINAPSALIPKKTFEKYGIYDENYCIEDYEFWLRVSVDGNIGYLDQVTVYYRLTTNSLSRFDKSRKAINRFKKVLNDTLAIYHKYESYCSYSQKKIFYNKYLSTAIDLQNKESINLITENMRNDNIKINHSNYIKHILFNLRLYTIAKMIFNVLKKR